MAGMRVANRWKRLWVAIIVVFIWFLSAQIIAVRAGAPIDYPLYRTVSLIEMVWILISWTCGVVVLLNSFACLRDLRILATSGVNGQMLRRARANLRNERSRAYLSMAFLALGYGSLLSPETSSQSTIENVIIVDFLISAVFIKLYCSVMDRVERQEDVRAAWQSLTGHIPARRRSDIHPMC